MALAAVNVFPDPGGPWIGRYEPLEAEDDPLGRFAGRLFVPSAEAVPSGSPVSGRSRSSSAAAHRVAEARTDDLLRQVAQPGLRGFSC